MIEILCRFDALKQAPVVFLSDTINGDKIQVWSDGNKPAYVPLDYYHMTAPLSAADERVLMERFKVATNKQDQVVNIRRRLPRNMRALPNLLANNGNAPALKDVNPPPANTTPARSRKSAALGIDQQKAPEAPQGAPTPEEGLTLATPVQAPVAAPTAPAAPVVNDGLASTALWAKIEQLNAQVQALTTQRTVVANQLQAIDTDLDAVKQAAAQVIAEYNAAIEAEAAEQLRKRQEMLAQLTASVGVPAPTEAAPAPAEQPAPAPAAPPAAEQKAETKPRGNGGKFVAKAGNKPAVKGTAQTKK